MNNDHKILTEVDHELTRALTILSDHQFRVAVQQVHDKIREHLTHGK